MKALRRSLIAALTAIALAACNGGNPPPSEPADYLGQIQADRKAKDEAFRNQPNNPVPPDKVSQYVPLKYFPADPDYAVAASLTPSAERVVVPMPTSAGKIRNQQRVGVLEFTLKGQPLTLGAYVEEGADLSRLFVPFTDMTSGTETYAAGRYLELDKTASGVYTVDFNKAYNPWCYYNEDFDCPYPPKDSRLPLPIRAGERLP